MNNSHEGQSLWFSDIHLEHARFESFPTTSSKFLKNFYTIQTLAERRKPNIESAS